MSAISPPVQAVIDLFAEPLRDVRFADVGASTLAELAASTQAAAEVVAAREAELAEARQALQERQDALLVQAQRALAYARVYAETDPVLTERLEQIALPRAARRPRADGDVLVLQPDAAPRARRPASPVGDPTADRASRRRAPVRAAQTDPSLVPELTSVDSPSP
jgi:hypothetical protein